MALNRQCKFVNEKDRREWIAYTRLVCKEKKKKKKLHELSTAFSGAYVAPVYKSNPHANGNSSEKILCISPTGVQDSAVHLLNDIKMP